MLGVYLPILLLVVIAICFGLGALVFSSFIGPKKPSALKLQPYECGCEPVGVTAHRPVDGQLHPPAGVRRGGRRHRSASS